MAKQADDVISAHRRTLQSLFAGATVTGGEQLQGGVSSLTTRWQVTSGGAAQHLVLRSPRWDNPKVAWQCAQREWAVLQLARSAGLAVPRTVALSHEGPTLVLEYVDGAPVFAVPVADSALLQLAEQLRAIHQVTEASHDLRLLPERVHTVETLLRHPPLRLDDELREGEIRSALLERGCRCANASVLLHGDYWPGNVLWKNGRVSAVIDWEESERGDPLADLAIARLDLLWAFGAESMCRFTDCYFELAAAGGAALAASDLPWWDLVASLRPASRLDVWASAYREAPISRPDITLESMRVAHDWFVEAALCAWSTRRCPSPTSGPKRGSGQSG